MNFGKLAYNKVSDLVRDENFNKLNNIWANKIKLENNKFKTIIGKVEEINGNDVKILLRKDSSRDLKEGLKVSARVKTGI